MPAGEYENRVNKALDFIQTHLYDEIDLNRLAQEACFSPYHFHRIFKAVVGETPSDYRERLRLEKAANMLIQLQDYSVTEIALTTGFATPSTFARSFKKFYGVPAQSYRMNHWKSDRKENPGNVEPKHPEEFYPVKNIVIRNFPDRRIAFTRSRGGYGKNIGQAWNQLFRWAYARDLVRKETEFLGIPWDNPGVTETRNCRYYACITVPENVQGSGHVSTMVLPGGKIAVYHFEGKDCDISRAYESLYGRWMPESGFLPDDRPGFESYIELPDDRPDRILRYDICIPVKPL